MGYGVTSTSLLLTIGLAPALASASVHLAEIGTSGISGLSHWRLGNVDGRVLLLIGIPGGVGAFLGAVVLANLSLDAARPTVSLVLLVLGAFIVVRFLRRRSVAARVPARAPRSGWKLVPLGLVGGFFDASGGGGWGALTTSSLMAAASLRPRTVIGTVSGSEFIVSIAASAGFLLALGGAGIDPAIVAMLLLGGAVAAPLSAYLVSRFDDRPLGAAVGGLIIVLNLDRGLSLFGVDPSVAFSLRVVTGVAALLAVAGLVIRARRRVATASEA